MGCSILTAESSRHHSIQFESPRRTGLYASCSPPTAHDSCQPALSPCRAAALGL